MSRMVGSGPPPAKWPLHLMQLREEWLLDQATAELSLANAEAASAAAALAAARAQLEARLSEARALATNLDLNHWDRGLAWIGRAQVGLHAAALAHELALARRSAVEAEGRTVLNRVQALKGMVTAHERKCAAVRRWLEARAADEAWLVGQGQRKSAASLGARG